jgi:exopolyphosphatase/guanosine-5'-triphosphate,3'-diphosphate pyrophosphatase
MRVAALDLGSNTSLLLIVEVAGQTVQRVLHDETTITRLGQGVHHDRKLHSEALARMDACLSRYQKTILEHKCEKVIAVATSAARDVRNGDKLIDLGKKYGIPIHIISGAREAELTYNGALSDRSDRDGLAVVDVGGGSTEIITSHDKQVQSCSINIGSVRLTELCVHSDPLSLAEQKQLYDYVAKEIVAHRLPVTPIREVVAVAGTPTTLAALTLGRPFAEEWVHGFKLSAQKLGEWVERLARMPLPERAQLPGMQAGRADVIVVGAMILAGVMQALNKQEMTVSTRGVRYGVALAWEEF